MEKTYEVGLYEHNVISYEKVRKMFKKENRVCISHATGTGKSYIALQLIYDTLKENPNKKVLFLAPTNGILEQFAAHIQNLGLKNVTLRTYQSLLNLSEEELKKIECDLLICDECHRLGAEEWKKRIDILTETHPKMKIFGITATPVRARGTSEENDISETFFHGNVASTYSLAEAIADGVLPNPDYHIAVAVLEDECAELEKIIQNGNASEEEKQKYKKILKTVKDKISQGEKTSDLLKKHIKKGGKYIYFCPPGSDIEELQNKFLEDLYPDITAEEVEMYQVINGEIRGQTDKENKQNSDNFRYNKSNTGLDVTNKTKVMFAINMYNEGIHVNDIDGVIMCRQTSSEIIFYQQLGRALAVTKSQNKPVVLDFMNNFEKILSLQKHIRDIKKNENREISDDDYDESYTDYTENDIRDLLKVAFDLDEEIIDVLETFLEVRGFAQSLCDMSFEEKLNYIQTEFIDKNEHFPKDKDTQRFSDGTLIGSWLGCNKEKIMKEAENGNETALQICKLRNWGVDLFTERLNYIQTEFFNKNKPLPKKKDTQRFLDGTSIGGWISNNKDKIMKKAENGNEIAFQLVKLKKWKVDIFAEKLNYIGAEFIDKNEPLPKDKDTQKFLDGTSIGGWISNNKEKIMKEAEKGNETALQIVKLKNWKVDIFAEKLNYIGAEFIDKNESLPKFGDAQKFSDGTSIYGWISNNKEKIMKEAEKGDGIFLQICKLKHWGIDMFTERLNYIGAEFIDKNESLPKSGDARRFSDGTSICRWIDANKEKIMKEAEKGNETALQICKLRKWNVFTEKLNYIGAEFIDKNNPLPEAKDAQRFSDGTLICNWIRKNKDKIMNEAENGNETAHQICKLKNWEVDLFTERLNYIQTEFFNKDKPLPKRSSKTKNEAAEKFPDGALIGEWISNNKEKIIKKAENGNETARQICRLKGWNVEEAREEFEESSDFSTVSDKIKSSNPKEIGEKENGRKIS